ncbi:MAG: epoxyqueuosine reductase QueH [Candidatus Omnitrophota bacterium]
MKKILLHICCGICASSVVQRLRHEGFKVFGVFYNPNIHLEDEYRRRLGVAREVCEILKFDLIPADYNKDNWLGQVKGLEDEPEGGKRCNLCFKQRLQETARKAQESGIDYFATTLSISPHKKAALINKIAKSIGGPIKFFDCDFKKKGGFALAIEFAKRYNLYRQNYCGCIYSKQRN